MSDCLQKRPEKAFGRTVRKADYEAEYQRVRDQVAAPEYGAIRREHSKMERKLGEVMNCHGGRRARYRARWKALMQELMACMVTQASKT